MVDEPYVPIGIRLGPSTHSWISFEHRERPSLEVIATRYFLPHCAHDLRLKQARLKVGESMWARRG